MEPIPRILRWTEIALALSWLALTGGAMILLALGLSDARPSPVETAFGAVLMALAAFVGITAVRLVDHLRGPGSAEARVRRPIPWLTAILLVTALVMSSGWWRLLWILAIVPYVLDWYRARTQGSHATGA